MSRGPGNSWWGWMEGWGICLFKPLWLCVSSLRLHIFKGFQDCSSFSEWCSGLWLLSYAVWTLFWCVLEMRMGDSCLTSRNWAYKQPQLRGGENDQHSSVQHGLKFLSLYRLYPYRWANLVFHPMVKWWSVETAVFGQSCCATCWSTIWSTSTTIVRPIKLDYYEISSGRFRCVFFSFDRPKKGLTYFQKTLCPASDWPPIAGAFTTWENLYGYGPWGPVTTPNAAPSRRHHDQGFQPSKERTLLARGREMAQGKGLSNRLGMATTYGLLWVFLQRTAETVFLWLPQQCQACQFMVYSWHCRLVWWLYRSLPNRNLTYHWTVVLWSQCFGLKLTESLGTTLQQPWFKYRLQSRNISEFPFNIKTSLNQILCQLVHVFLRRRCNGRRTICWSYANSWEA